MHVYVCMHKCIFVPLNLRHLDCAITNSLIVDALHNKWDLHFTIIGHKSASYITSSLSTVFSSAFYSITC